jgi:hypothetical protein
MEQEQAGELVGGDGGLVLMPGADEEIHARGQVEERLDGRALRDGEIGHHGEYAPAKLSLRGVVSRPFGRS